MTLLGYNEILIRLLVSVALGGLIGLERERTNRPAGFRTHILLTLGSCLAMLVSAYAFETSSPGRIGAQVISGIGFLCAGTILKEGNSVIGLTSAATLWLSGTIGLSIGAGMYAAGITATVITIISLTVLNKIENIRKIRSLNFSKKRKERELKSTNKLYQLDIYTISEWQTLEKIRETIKEENLSIVDISISKDKLYTKITMLIKMTEQYQDKVTVMKAFKDVETIESMDIKDIKDIKKGQY